MTKPSDSARILHAISSYFVESIDQDNFNGITAHRLLDLDLSESAIRPMLASLVKSGKINCTFSRYDLNVHIKRLPSLSSEKQIEFISEDDLHQIACYPTEPEIRKNFDLEKLNDRPYTKMLAAGRSQLEFVSFDFAALERYFNDPRFLLRFEDYGGRLSIKDEYYNLSAEGYRDDVSIQTFGLGFDDRDFPVAIVFLRYLATLNSAHQLYWKSYEAVRPAKMCLQYYQSSIQGVFFENASLIHAIRRCIEGINENCESIFGKKLFRESIPDIRPPELSIFVRPTKKNFLRFVVSLDHLLSENFNESIFPDSIARTEIKVVRDRQVEQKVGSIRLYETWLFDIYQFHSPSEARSDLIEPFLEVRKLRQKPAHQTTEDQYDEAFYEQREQLLAKVFRALLGLLEILEGHPKGHMIDLRPRIREGRLDPW